MKMKKLNLFIALCMVSVFGNAQMPIATARTQGLGQTVTIKGIATNGSELGQIRYIQDATGAIAIYGNNLSGVARYDSITVTGTLTEFSGLLEITPVSSITDHGPALVPPTPLSLPITNASETYEAQYIEIHNVTFVQTGNFAANTTYQVTDGTNNLDLRVTGSGTNIDGTAIPTGALTIRGLLGQFNANYQITPRALDDMIAYVAPDKEISVKIDGNNVLNGGNYFMGNSSNLSVSIENAGTNSLSITGASFSGTNAADFSSNIVAGSVAASGSNAYSITFTPSGNGTRTASISIGNNDADENPFIINFEAVGQDNLATEPSSNASNLTFNNIEAYTLSGNYNAGTNATKYIVLWKNGSTFTATPVDGQSYKRGDIIGDAKVAFVGSGTGFTPRGIIANQNYYFKVFAFNGQGGYENYLTTSPATGNTTSAGANIGNYYNGISSSSATLLTDLKNLINPHNQLTYFIYKETILKDFEIQDTTNGQSYVECVYSGERKVFDEPFDWSAQGYSREHSFCHSWMPSYPANSPEKPEYTDQHHLFPTNLNDVNSPRSNLPLGEITGAVQYTFLDCKIGYNGPQMVFEPRDEHKGNAARAIMYVATCYNFPLDGNAASTKQDFETLKAWHFQDLPDNYEIARHEYVYSVQNNRNPYIDSVDFVCHIDIDDNSYVVNGCTASIEEQLKSNFSIFPVPSSDKVFLQVNDTKITAYTVVDLNGKIISNKHNISEDVLILDSTDFESGVYIVKIETPFGSVQDRMIIK